jgi:hypothetical protein
MRGVMIVLGVAALLAVLAGSDAARARGHDHARHASSSAQATDVQAAAAAGFSGSQGAVQTPAEARGSASAPLHRSCTDSCGPSCATGLMVCGCAAVCHALMDLGSVDLYAPPCARELVCGDPGRRPVAARSPPVPPPRG